jgi:hypothetical protein
MKSYFAVRPLASVTTVFNARAKDSTSVWTVTVFHQVRRYNERRRKIHAKRSEGAQWEFVFSASGIVRYGDRDAKRRKRICCAFRCVGSA